MLGYKKNPNIKISINHLKVGDLVVGTHFNQLLYKIVAGEIIKVIAMNSCDVIYHVRGGPCAEPEENLSGILGENEIEVINPSGCNMIIELYDLAHKQINAGVSCQETIGKINDIRYKSRQELEEKYPVGHSELPNPTRLIT